MSGWPAKQERRRWRRHWLNAPVRIISEAGVAEGFGFQVSEGGIYLFALVDFEPGTRVVIEYKEPKSGKRTRCSGLVRTRVVYLYVVEFFRNPSPAGSGRFQPEAAIKS